MILQGVRNVAIFLRENSRVIPWDDLATDTDRLVECVDEFLLTE